MKTYKLIIKTDCPFCKNAVELLVKKEIPFVVTVTDKNPSFLQKQKDKWNWTTIPIVLEENEETEAETLIGGFAELEDLLRKE